MMQDPSLVLITGTSRGIGNELAQHFLDAGWTVVGCSRGDYDGLRHERYVHRVLDIRSEPEVVDLFRWIRGTYGGLDAVINNAAVNPALSLVALTPAAAFADTLTTNVVGSFLVAREAVKLMMRQKRGRIVNLGSMATRHEVEGEAAYTASKAALNAFTRVLAKETAPHGITVNVVAPAAIAGGLADAVDEAKLLEVLGRNAVHERGSVADIAATINWLLAPESAGVTAQIIYLGGA